MASENIVFYEKLVEAVRNYPFLCDKSSNDFKDTNKKKLCWKDVAKAVGVRTGKRTSLSCVLERGYLKLRLTCVGCLRGLEAGLSLTLDLVSLSLLLAGLDIQTERKQN